MIGNSAQVGQPLPARRRRAPGGFTLIEVLATIMLMAIALPAIMKGISVASQVASYAKSKTEAAGLGHAQLMQFLSDQTWQSGDASGNFGSLGADWAKYDWRLSVGQWSQDDTGLGLEELDLTVTWTQQGAEHSITLTAMAYQRGVSSASSS